MEKISNEDMETLYEAATRGCVVTLNTLTQKDKLILSRVSLTSFVETPLHISSLLGHLDFSIALLRLYPKMSAKLDSFRRSPLHLASAEGHTEVVKALLSINTDVCLIRDQGGRVPLHLAAMRGNVETIHELVSACPESSSVLLDGETVFHLCVSYNNLEALELLVKIVDDDRIIKGGNRDGNTILHIAVMLKQVETIRFLVSIPRIRAGVDNLNSMEFTALDILERSHKDFKNLEIKETLIRAGVGGGGRGSERRNDKTKMVETLVPPAAISKRPVSRRKELFDKYKRYVQLQENWMEETRGTLMTVAALIATITFQASMSPPGGVWQQDDRTSSHCNSTNVCLAGTAVFGHALPKDHALFMTYNSISFVASLVVIFLIISGFPLGNKFVTWFLTVAMSTTVVFMALTYLVSMDMVTPDNILNQLKWIKRFALLIWLGSVVVVSVVHIFRLCLWISNKARKVCTDGKKWWTKLQCQRGSGQNTLAAV
ncbi:ankyrin repeat-containing protein BDA1 [Euphorbia lathyris]|uniref:ankyrin repeat-containing protein BDA1 n=1 Tax=Euphorbia lathyris TaxID=212925 RepID=UPI0033140E11